MAAGLAELRLREPRGDSKQDQNALVRYVVIKIHEYLIELSFFIDNNRFSRVLNEQTRNLSWITEIHESGS